MRTAPSRKTRNVQRRFIDAPQSERCLQDIVLRDGSGAQCGRRGLYNGLCKQHFHLAPHSIKARMMNGAHYEDAVYAEKKANRA